jgi:hypothetical protein
MTDVAEPKVASLTDVGVGSAELSLLFCYLYIPTNK